MAELEDRARAVGIDPGNREEPPGHPRVRLSVFSLFPGIHGPELEKFIQAMKTAAVLNPGVGVHFPIKISSTLTAFRWFIYVSFSIFSNPSTIR